jgi:peroxiredoxin
VQAVKDQLESKGVAIVVVSFAEPARLASYQSIHQWPFPILADPDRAAYLHFGLGRLAWRHVFSPSTIKFYAGMLLKGRKLENYDRDDYRQSGGDFIVDKTGEILFAHRSHDPADRPKAEELLAVVDSLHRRRSSQATRAPRET